jgi:hypothetical protein
MFDTPRRPLLRTVPAALVGTGLAGVVDADGAEPTPVADGGGGTLAAAGADVRYLTRRRTTDVTPSGVDEVRIGPSEGHLLELQSVTASAPPVAAANSGRHAIEVGVAGGDLTILRGVASARQPLSFDGATWREADREAAPSGDVAGVLATRGLRFDDDVTLSVRYRNDTNATQTDARTVAVWGVERPVDGAAGTDA